MRNMLLLIPLFYCLIVVVLYINQRNLMYHPDKQKHELVYYNLDGTEEVTLHTKDNIKLQAWFRRSNGDGEMVIFLHGNAGSLENRINHLRQLSEMGYGFIIPAWRGFGKSEGFPTEEGLYLDAEAVIDYIKSKGYKVLKIIMIGESLGTGIAVRMAQKYKFKGLFLIAPYTSIADRAGEIYPYMLSQYLTKDNFKVLDNIDKINQPLFMIHGTADKVVPYEHAKKIFAKAKEPKKFITYDGIGHNNYNIKDAFSKMQIFLNSQ